ncbi:unnamed protein product [Pylaiella littoralis]
MREASHPADPGTKGDDRDVAPTTGVAPPSTPPDFVVEDLRDKLKAAAIRERQLHQHLLFHIQEKDVLVNKITELQRVCEALLLSQMQEPNGPAAVSAIAEAKAALSPTGGGAGPPAPSVDLPTVSSTTSTGIDVRDNNPVVNNSNPINDNKSDVAAGGIVRPEAAHTTAALVVGGGRAATGAEPAVDIPQLLFERGGRIRITALWEAYQARFGETPYSLKDLFSMVKAGTIPFVVHEPPAGIRLLPSAPVYQQQRQRQQQQQQHQHQQQQAVAQTMLGQSYHMKGGGLASPVTSSPNVGVGGVITGAVNQQQQQQQPPFSQPLSLASPQAALGKGPQDSGLDESGAVGGIPGTGTTDERITFGWTGSDPPPPPSASATLASEWPRASSAFGDSKTVAEGDHDDTVAASDTQGNSNGWGEKEQGDGDHQLRFGSFGVVGPSDPGTAASDGGGAASGPAATAGRPSSSSSSSSAAAQKREVNWKELNSNLNLLLKEEGGVSGRDLTHCFQQRFGKSPYLDGTPLRYAVSAGWLKGVCFDLYSMIYNLTFRVPASRREPPPEGAPAQPPASQSWTRSTVPGVVPEAPLADYVVDWKRLSVEFRQLLLEGALEPAEVHAKYHREFKKPFNLAGYSMRQAVIDGLLGGIMIERGSRRLMCA